jgi:ribosomal protein L11 methyltransferase
MKTEKVAGGAILTLMIQQDAAESISDWVAENWAKAVVELKQPGSTQVLLEIYFDNALEAELAGRALEMFPVRGRSVREYAAEEWTESWKKHFKPMDIGRRLRVTPPWLAGQSDRLELVINPGLSFGTGNHFTTRFCLEQLDRFVPETGAKTMLDVGTGSGVLAIAAVKLGAEQALGVDFDPICIECSLENALANGVAQQTAFRQHDITNGWPDESFDIVCANIYATLLIDNASTLLRITKNRLLLTGIREVELDGVAEAFARLGGRELVRDCDGEWSGLVFSPR